MRSQHLLKGGFYYEGSGHSRGITCWRSYRVLLGVYLEINQAAVAGMAVAFDRKPSAGVGFELHHCGDMWRYFSM